MAQRRMPWVRLVEWSVASHVQSIDNARTATTELSRRRVEREEVELYLAETVPGSTTVRPARRSEPGWSVAGR